MLNSPLALPSRSRRAKMYLNLNRSLSLGSGCQAFNVTANPSRYRAVRAVKRFPRGVF